MKSSHPVIFVWYFIFGIYFVPLASSYGASETPPAKSCSEFESALGRDPTRKGVGRGMDQTVGGRPMKVIAPEEAGPKIV